MQSRRKRAQCVKSPLPCSLIKPAPVHAHPYLMIQHSSPDTECFRRSRICGNSLEINLHLLFLKGTQDVRQAAQFRVGPLLSRSFQIKAAR